MNHELLPLPVVIVMCFLASHTFVNVTGEESRLGVTADGHVATLFSEHWPVTAPGVCSSVCVCV